MTSRRNDARTTGLKASKRRFLTRRHIIASALGVAGASTLSVGLSRPGGGLGDLMALAAQGPQALCEPYVLASENGLLSVELVAGIDSSRGGGGVARTIRGAGLRRYRVA